VSHRHALSQGSTGGTYLDTDVRPLTLHSLTHVGSVISGDKRGEGIISAGSKAPSSLARYLLSLELKQALELEIQLPV